MNKKPPLGSIRIKDIIGSQGVQIVDDLLLIDVVNDNTKRVYRLKFETNSDMYLWEQKIKDMIQYNVKQS